MKWHRIGLVFAAPLALSCAPMVMDGSSTYFGFTLGVESAPPPPRVVFVREPEMYMEPGTSVYVVSSRGADCDMFRYGSSFYMYYEGYWYRSNRYSGPFVAIDVRRVPRPVLTVPEGRWRHHPHGGPPGLTKKERDG